MLTHTYTVFVAFFFGYPAAALREVFGLPIHTVYLWLLAFSPEIPFVLYVANDGNSDAVVKSFLYVECLVLFLIIVLWPVGFWFTDYSPLHAAAAFLQRL
jgi:hypothetical protein